MMHTMATDERTRYRVRIASATKEVAEVLGGDPTARSPYGIAEMLREEERGRVWDFHKAEYREV